MLDISFHPESDHNQLVQAANDYQAIWEKEREKILTAIKRVSNLSFVENHLNAIVFEGVSFSRPLMLRASYPESEKRTALIHELCHRLLEGNGIKVPRGLPLEAGQLLSHKYINLILFDILSDLYGEPFAREAVRVESARKPVYAQAWQWALAMHRNDRAEKFSRLIV